MSPNGHRMLRTLFRLKESSDIAVVFSGFVDEDFDDTNIQPLTSEGLDYLGETGERYPLLLGASA